MKKKIALQVDSVEFETIVSALIKYADRVHKKDCEHAEYIDQLKHKLENQFAEHHIRKRGIYERTKQSD